jgi:hypothetical protein
MKYDTNYQQFAKKNKKHKIQYQQLDKIMNSRDIN